ncbi:hypothetical protein [Haloarcula brevis]|uniref:hypothetical protein n=1 Tax=Haloarcula brevis TaxID=3111453 RepID=UPI00300F692E
MLDKIKESVSDVLSGGKRRSDGRRQSDTGDGSGGEAAADESESNLFECPSCESVFVAIDKETCSACQTPVERID